LSFFRNFVSPNMEPNPSRPRLPRLLSLPLGWLPGRLNSTVAAEILNRVFATERRAGELDFLLERVVRIQVEDATAGFAVRLGEAGFSAAEQAEPDLAVTGSLYDFLLLVTGREDPDSLFFQRHLRLDGNTALGVHLKNFLASVDPASLPLATLVNPALRNGLRLFERWSH